MDEIKNKLNEHSGQLLAIQAVMLALTSKVDIDGKVVEMIIEKTPLSGDDAAQTHIRSESKRFVERLITRRVQ